MCKKMTMCLRVRTLAQAQWQQGQRASGRPKCGLHGHARAAACFLASLLDG